MWISSQISLLESHGCTAMPVLPSDSGWEQGQSFVVFFAEQLDAVWVQQLQVCPNPNPTQCRSAKSWVLHSSSIQATS